jgi:hypothetical protein
MSKNIADLNTFLHQNFRADLKPNENAVEAAMRLLTLYKSTADHLQRRIDDENEKNAESYKARREADKRRTGIS